VRFRALVVLVAAAVSLGQLSAVPALAAERSVRDIQKALADKGFRPGVPDGVWGKKSIAALRAYQTANGLSSTGTVDTETIDRLFPPLATMENQKRATSSDPEKLPDAHQMPATIKEPDTPATGPTQNHTDTAFQDKPAEGTVSPTNAAPVVEIHDSPQPAEKSARLTAPTSSSSATPASPALMLLGSFALIGLIMVFRYRRKAKRLPAEVSKPDTSPVGNLIWDREAFRTLAAETIRPGTEKIPFPTEPPVQQSAKKLYETVAADVASSDSSHEAAPVEVVPGKREVPPAPSPERVASMKLHNKGVADWVQFNASRSPDTDLPAPQSAKKLDEIGSTEVASSDSPYESAPVEADSGKRKLPPAPSPERIASMKVHNKSVADWVRSKASRAPKADGNDGLTEIAERGQTATVFHAAIPRPSTSFSLLNFYPPRTTETKLAQSDLKTDDAAKLMAGAEWVVPGKSVMVASETISGGLFYLGGFLGKQGRLSENENCLVNPALKVGSGHDHSGISMGYWPSYSHMSPDARRSYLEWLAGSRSNPGDYIGYVFLYFYGLERRLLLDQNLTDGEAVLAEVRRLLEVYGHNGSFNRYATELLTVAELKSGEPSAQFLDRIEPNGFEVPAAVKIALGVRVRDQRPIEADLMLRFALTHPETSVRTPAKRVPALLRELYQLEFAKLYPDGYRLKPGRTKKLNKRYQACSGTFGLDVKILGGDIPDITDREEPIRMARRVFNACVEQLDDYSRALGRLPGLEPNLLATARLPEALRLTAANRLSGDPLDRLRRLAEENSETAISILGGLVGLDLGVQQGKAKLRELSQALASFGIGATFDPTFAVRSSATDERAVLFSITGTVPAEATEAYRTRQLSVMLGMIVGHADGHFHELERKAILQGVAEADDLSADDKRRLAAEVRLNEGDAARLDEWLKRLKDIPDDACQTIASELIALASADGNLHADEVRKLEAIFKRMGIDPKSLYERLHAGTGTQPAIGTTYAPSADAAKFPASPSPTRIDLSRLQSIRSETRVTSDVLAGIFVDDDDEAVVVHPEPVLDVQQSELFEGLEQRYGAFLSEILLRSSWSKEDFEHLARDASLLPGAAKEVINDWSLDRFDELMIEGDDALDINLHLLPNTQTSSAIIKEGMPA
jgi:tellurite resistance protein